MFGNTTLVVSHKHHLSISEAFQKINEWTQDLCFENPNLFKAMNWKLQDNEEMHCLAKGKLIDANVIVAEGRVDVSITLSILARPFFSKIEGYLQNELKILLQSSVHVSRNHTKSTKH